MSMGATIGGVILLILHARLLRSWDAAPRPEAKAIFDALVGALTRLCRGFTNILHDDAISRYAAIFVVFTLVMGVLAYSSGVHLPGDRVGLMGGVLHLIGWICLVGSTLCIVVFHHNRLLSLVLLGVAGLMVTLTFNYFSAPDLALTQLSVEVVTIILLLLALNFMPKQTPKESTGGRKLRDLVISLGAGIGVGGLIYAIMSRDFAFSSISAFHLENSKPGGGGTNVVNVILVDFRGFDTFGEIIVLGIAAIVIFAITESILDSSVRAKLLNRVPDSPIAGDSHPLMMVVVTRVMMPVALMVAAYIFFRGHNLPGGGFIAGLVAAIAIIMQYMASGFGWAAARQQFPYHGIIGSGVLIAAVTGIGAWFNDVPFLTSDFGYFQFWFLDKFELATAALFDLGVFLAVVGAVLLALESLARYAWQPNQTAEFAMDINPARDDPEPATTEGGKP